MRERAPGTGSRLEFQRENLWVGLFVLGALLVFAVVALVAVQERVFRREYSLNSSFERIEGLRPGSEVRLRGYPVGRVTRITLQSSPRIRFDVEFTVDDAVQLPAGTRVRMSASGFASQVLDLITPGDASDPDAPQTPQPDRPLVLLQPGATLPSISGASLDSLFSDAVGLMRSLTVTIRNADGLLNERIGPRLEETLAVISNDVERLVPLLEATVRQARVVLEQTDAALTENRPRATRLLDTATEELRAAGEMVERMEEILTQIEERLTPIADNFDATLARARSLLTRTDAAMNEEEVREIVDNLKTLTNQARDLIADLRKRPWRLLRRVPGEKRELMEELEAQREAEAGEEQP